MDKILITGGSGLLGRHLSGKLKDKGYNVAILSRSPDQNSDIKSYFWDPAKDEIDHSAITEADFIIHLAGAGIGDKRWTAHRKKDLIDSRVKTADLIYRAVRDTGRKLKAFITISGSNYYGTISSEKIFSETDLPAVDFLGEVCRLWEEAADRFSYTGARVVKIRSGIVLAAKGGVMSRIIIPVRLGIGSPVGRGNQYVSWIHIDDLCNIFIKAIEDQRMSGAFNAAAPESVTNSDLMKTLANVLGKPFWFPKIPSFVMRLLFGRMSGILLEGSRISSEKIRSAGFSFQFPELKDALQDLLR